MTESLNLRDGFVLTPKNPTRRFNALRLARVILGSALLLSILSANIPFSVFASGPMCNLACCAGRAPHVAGSCMSGSCHISLNGRKRHIHLEPTIELGERLCGLQGIKLNSARLLVTEAGTIDVRSDRSPRTSRNASEQASLSTTALTKPCQSDCGSCGSSFTNSNRRRNAAALTHAARPRPPTLSSQPGVSSLVILTRAAERKQSRPRGPPLS